MDIHGSKTYTCDSIFFAQCETLIPAHANCMTLRILVYEHAVDSKYRAVRSYKVNAHNTTVGGEKFLQEMP